MAANFAIIGAAGYVAPRHMKAIKEAGGCLVAATDPHDSVGILDQYFRGVRYFPEIERFDRHLEKLRCGPEEGRVTHVSICSPNFLHDSHVRLALRIGAHAICEKPLVIKPWNLDYLQKIEEESGKRVGTILQLRVHPALLVLKEKIDMEPRDTKYDVVLTYVTGRGDWYNASWKGNEERSGGVAMNIGVHFFDLLLWLFGPLQESETHVKERNRMSGFLEFKHAVCRWFLSVDVEDLPEEVARSGQTTYRSIKVDGEEVEFTAGFTDLHTEVYRRFLDGRWFGIEDARPAIELVQNIREGGLVVSPDYCHPYARKRRETSIKR